ncbi:hypothetical protein PCANC_10011 [Puccinia coronata f. sp. avenae]|uniref:Uncharacterized protein n=1 Tax=Puccinia coronata f. sp. avenae TaxID=200324 RepID=A0A2N5URH1_9BASI|nr:hypothetical protein PCASD_16812 [Puccinia coronata f. sp. avenae]PLW40358.1 hypothetical protein PCASD_07288 [Puccinia coronata f. sp. avenae]PLW42994.1 hypothetical protein PCANC_10011 [Puccinia coronata f. sp. avenae]
MHPADTTSSPPEAETQVVFKAFTSVAPRRHFSAGNVVHLTVHTSDSGDRPMDTALMQCETGLAAARKASPEVCVPAKGVKSRTFGSRTNPSQLGSSKSREHLDRPSHLTV